MPDEMSDSAPQLNEARARAARLNHELRRAPSGSLPPIISAIPPVIRWTKPRPALLTPAELERFGNLLVFARSTVEGYFAGKHKSPFRGSSVEFADYKEYVAGDDPKRIDWRAYGRSRRLFVRQYEAETDMAVYLLVDVSASMDYTGGADESQSKYVLAARIAAALSYLMIHQGDKVALVLFSEQLKQFLPPGGTRRHLHHIVRELESVEPAFGTGIGHALSECDPLFKKRGKLVVLSDFWDDTAKTFESLSRFLHRKFEILLLHVVHPHELDLPSVHAARFHDMETHDEIEVEPEEIRAAYRESARQRSAALAREAASRCISYALVDTDRPYLDAIEAYLGFRGQNTVSAR
jgi:uncharacterized protein (DUF58 family)